MAFTDTKLSYFHSFSKMPAQDSTTLGNAINKSGHTVTASEVWAQDIPYYGKMGSLEDVKSKVQPYARKNDMCYITAGADKGKTFQYDGNGTWTDITATLIDGALIKNANDDVVLLYHKGQTLTNLTAENNANTDSANNAARLWAKRDTEGATIANNGTRLIEQFAAPTDKALNGLASVAYAPVIANGTLVSGTDYYDYCFSGTILWATARTASTVIDCFEYVGEKVSDVVDTVNTQGTAIQNVKDQVDTISDALGLGSEVVGTTLGSRVTDNENALKVLLGLAEGDKVAATESIATTAANAVSTSLAGSTDGTIGKAIADAKQEALDAINAIQHFSVEIVPEGQTIENVTPLVENTIYLVKEANTAEGTYIEYIAYKPAGSETVTYEKIGSTKLDLSGYTTDAEHTALADRVTALDTATTGRVAVVESEISTLKTTTIPAIQKSVTDLTKTVGDNKTAIEKALADAKTEIGTTTSGLDTRLQTAEGQIATITSTDATKEGSIAKALADAKTYAEGQASAAEAAAKTEASTNLSAAVEQIGKDIEAAKQAAISQAEVTINQGTGIAITGAGKGTTFTIAVDSSVATKASVEAVSSLVTGVSQTVESNKTELQGKIDAINASLTGTTDGTIGKAIADVKATADSAVQSVTKASGSSDLLTVTDGTDVTISLSTEVATKTDVADAKKAGTDAASALNTAKGQSLAQTGTLSGMFSVATAGTVGTGITSITVTDAGLANAIADAKKAGTDAASALNTAKSQSLAQTGTLSGMFSVATVGTVGTGITSITISDTGLAAAITKAKTDAEATAAANLATARGEITTEIATEVSKITTGEGSLGKKVEALETATGTTLPAAIEQALTDAKAYSDSLHTTSLDYVVLGDSESLPTASADTLGKIYLVKEGNTANGETGIDAISGSYVEYMTRKVSETEYTWEKIGTTAADLNAYAKTADVTSSIATAKSEAIAAAKTETTTQVNALAATHATDKAALEGSISTINNTIAAMDADLSVNGISVKQVDGKVTELSEALITASVPVGTTKVEGNVAYVGSTKHVIAPEKFETAAQMPATLTSWVADLSNLTNGNNMFKSCTGLTTFVGDLSSLTSGVDMFYGCALDAESLEILSETLPTVSGGTINIGASTNATAEMIATIKGKGWTLKSNDTTL